MQKQDIILDVKNLSTTFVTDRREVRIVKDVSFQVRRGGALAIVGESGCGKTVTMNSVMRFLGRNARIEADAITYNEKRSDGSIVPHALEKLEKPNCPEMRALRGPGISMVFQDPMTSLDPVYRVGEQVMEGLLQHEKLSRSEAKARVIGMFRKLGIPDPEQRFLCYPHEFSGGMKQRVVIAIAMICNPELIICDEPTTALDVTIQAQIMDILKDLQRTSGKSIILITHNMGLVAQMAEEVCVMYMGRVVEFGSLEDVFDRPSHPYTRALLRSVPALGMDRSKRLETIPGATPNPAKLGEGCEFADRCAYCTDACRKGVMPVSEVSPGHTVRCLNYMSVGEVEHHG